MGTEDIYVVPTQRRKRRDGTGQCVQSSLVQCSAVRRVCRLTPTDIRTVQVHTDIHAYIQIDTVESRTYGA